jgi:uncharacterized membrane protein
LVGAEPPPLPAAGTPPQRGIWLLTERWPPKAKIPLFGGVDAAGGRGGKTHPINLTLPIMMFLILCILANVGIFTCFRLFMRYQINTFHAIAVNYLVCVITGSIFMGTEAWENVFQGNTTWIYIGLILGGIFIGTFYLMARTTQIFSMTVSSIATKMSLVIPVLFSLLILNIQSREYTWLNYTGMVLALVAILASSYKPRKVELSASNTFQYLLPIAIFILGGIIDSTINFVSFRYLKPEEEGLFPIIIFSSAAVLGWAIVGWKREALSWRSVLGGLVLGFVNYFSVYYLVRSLRAFNHDGALVYPLVNVGIILVASLVSAILFKEHLSLLNKIGILLSVLTILLLSYQEIFTVL